MSLISVGRQFAQFYQKPRELPAAGGTEATDESSPAEQFTKYIPSDILTIYLAWTTAIVSLSHGMLPLAAPYLGYAEVAFIVCMILTPAIAYASVAFATEGWPSWKAFVWPMISACIAFPAYVLVVPGSWLNTALGLQSSIWIAAVIVVVPLVLRYLGKLYIKIVPVQ